MSLAKVCTMVEGAAVPFETSMIDITGTDTQATILISRPTGTELGDRNFIFYDFFQNLQELHEFSNLMT